MRAARWIRFAVIACALMPQTRAAALPGCQPTTYQYCGEHWRSSNLPIRFHLNAAGAPSSVKASQITAALSGAVQAWNLAWPRVTDVDPSPALRAAGTTSVGFGRDGQNTIVFGDPAWCGGRADALAVACTWYEGASGSAAKRIKEVDVILNPGTRWRQAVLGALVTGEAVGVSQYPAAGCDGWFDLQSSLTHELGHALGLRHIGEDQYFPSYGQDALRFTQTMYRWDYPCTTNKRTLDAGDAAGAEQVALATYSD